MSASSFFDESTEQSRTKAEIVAKYLKTWAKIIIPSAKIHSNKIGYLDLFAGTGRYKDGTKSTPILVLEKAISDNDLKNMLVTMFTDSDPKKIVTLKKNISMIPSISTLIYQPKIQVDTIGLHTSKELEAIKMIPCLTFLDPWGYKGLSRELFRSVLKDWGCECILFFNYNRINMGIRNPKVKTHIDALFGQERANQLRTLVHKLNTQNRENAVLSALEETIKEIGCTYLLAFRFRSNTHNRISHHLIFVSKHYKGYQIMKDIMAKASSSAIQGVPSFEYSPTPLIEEQLTLFEEALPLNKLKKSILDTFHGHTLSVQQLFDQHNVGTSYIKKNYKEALKDLETCGDIQAKPPAAQRKKNTMGDSVMITIA